MTANALMLMSTLPLIISAALVLLAKRSMAALFLVVKSAFYIVFPVIAFAVSSAQAVDFTVGQVVAVVVFYAGAVCASLIVPTIPPSTAMDSFVESGKTRDGVSALLLLCVVLFVANVYVMLEYDLVVRRIGTEAIAGIYADLPAIVRLVLRLWEIMLGAALSYLAFSRKPILGRVGRWTALLMWILYFAYTLISSRLLVVDLMILVLIVLRVDTRAAILWSAPVAFLLATTTYLYRASFEASTILGDLWSQWVERLDCVSLLGEIDSALWDVSPPLLGESWFSAVIARIHAFVDPTFQSSFLADAETGSKNVISSVLMLEKGPDYPSCSVSDVFANFWLPGVLLLGFAMIWIMSRLETGFVASTNALRKTAYLAALGTLLVFERDFSDMTFNMIVVLGLFAFLHFGLRVLKGQS